MQMDQLSRLWIPPDYVRTVKVSYGATPVLEVEGDIALSEDPAISFSFVPEGPGAMTVQVEDTNGRKFEQSWPVGPTSVRSGQLTQMPQHAPQLRGQLFLSKGLGQPRQGLCSRVGYLRVAGC